MTLMTSGAPWQLGHSDHYLSRRDTRDVEPRKMPWITTDAFDPWLTRLRALRGR